jgi:hypothetical protein
MAGKTICKYCSSLRWNFACADFRHDAPSHQTPSGYFYGYHLRSIELRVTAMPLLQIVYISTARTECTPVQLEAILASSIRHNKQNGITGLLVYLKGTFMQVIEGEEPAMRETYGRIKADTRHYNLLNLIETPLVSREFPSWHMALRTAKASAIPRNPQLLALVAGALDAERLKATPSDALSILSYFAES